MSNRQTVLIVKRDTIMGPEPEGSTFTVRLPADLDRQQAIWRAWALFRRDKPEENQMCWAVEGGA